MLLHCKGMKHKSTPSLLSGALISLALLATACVPPPPYEPGVQLNFTLPDAAASQKLQLAAVTFQGQDDGSVKMETLSGYGYVEGTTARLYLDGYALKQLAANTRCVTPFVGGESRGMQNVSVTPDTVKTCNIYFLAYQDGNGDGKPTREEERYNTHDVYGYATEAFRYSMTTADGNSTESGQRTQGWSLVRHLVLQPSATPGKYQVTMNSLPTTDQAISIRLHEPSDFMTSMSLGGQE